MRTAAYFVALPLGLMALLLLIRPLTAQSVGGTLEQRVAILEAQVSVLNQRVAALERHCNIVWKDETKRVYTGIGETWRIKILPKEGGVIVLANNTKWQPKPEDARWVNDWDPLDILQIGVSRNTKYPYTLTNLKKQQKIEAAYLGSN